MPKGSKGRLCPGLAQRAVTPAQHRRSPQAHVSRMCSFRSRQDQLNGCAVAVPQGVLIRTGTCAARQEPGPRAYRASAGPLQGTCQHSAQKSGPAIRLGHATKGKGPGTRVSGPFLFQLRSVERPALVDGQAKTEDEHVFHGSIEPRADDPLDVWLNRDVFRQVGEIGQFDVDLVILGIRNR